jgi:type I restriction enzyme S subunit
MLKEKMLVPQLRFSEFGNKWKTKIYGEIYTFYSTNSYSRDNLNYESGLVKNIHYGDIHKRFSTIFDINKEQVPFLNSDIVLSKIKKENYCLEGDLVVADASEDYTDIGKTIEIKNLNGELIIAGLHTFLARPNKFKMTLGFSGYLVKSWKVRKQIMVIAQGTKVLGLSTSRLSKIKLVIPQSKEQQKIANFFTAIDNRIQTLEKKKSGLEQYKKGLMQKIFKQELRFKDDTSTSLSASDGKAFPEWNKVQLSDIAERVKAKNKIDNQNVLTISAQLGLVSQLEYFNKSVSAKNLKGYYLLERNDFAYNKSYSNGYPMGAIKRLDKYDLGVVSTLYICFRFNEKVSHNFMEHYFDAGLQNRAIEKVAQEGARNHGLLNIGVNDFFEINLKIPSLAEQTKIANFLSAINENIELVTKKIEHTKTYKKGLLQQMFV